MSEAITAGGRMRRERGSGSVYPVKSGGYRGSLVHSDRETGRPKRYTVSGKTEAAVLAALDKLRADLEKLGRPEPKMTVAAYLARWLEAEASRVRPSTFRGRRQQIADYIVPAIGALKLRDLRPSDVERVVAGMLAGGLSARTAMHTRSTLRKALHDAERDGLVLHNVAALSRPPHVERREFHVLTADETRRLIDETAEDELGPLFTVAATTGLRQGEILGLSWSDVTDLDGSAPTLTVRRTLSRDAAGRRALAEPKTRKSRRTLELGGTAVRALRRQKARQAAVRLAAGDTWQGERDRLVFTDALGRSLDGTYVTSRFGAALKRLGLPHVRFHDLRHGAASLMLAEGTPMKVVSDTLGHSTITITADTYAHLDREQRRAASDAIERAIGGKA